MIYLIVHGLLSILTFWFPALLSIKALDLKDSGALQFLVNFWLSFVVLSKGQAFIQEYQVPMGGALCVVGDLLKMWMFYSHGCLVALLYLVPSIFGQALGTATWVNFERMVVEPFFTVGVVRNPFLQNALIFFNGARVPFVPIGDLLMFNHQLRELHEHPRRMSSLLFGVNYFCYVDTAEQLFTRYMRCKRFLWGISAMFRAYPQQRMQSVMPRTTSPDMDDELRREYYEVSSESPRMPSPQGTRIQRASSPRLVILGNAKKGYNLQPGYRGVRDGVEFSSKPRAASGGEPRLGVKMSRSRASSYSAGDPPYPILSEVPIK